MPPFDPDAYLSEELASAAFDPSAYLAAEGEGRTRREQEQVVSPRERAVLKNLLSNSAALQKEYLERKGYETRELNGTLQVRQKGGEWGVVDPVGFDLQDVTDVVGDVIEGVLVAAGTGVGAATGGIPGAIAGGVTSSVAAEAGRQSLAQLLGITQPGEGDVGEVIKAAGIGAAGGAVPSVLGKLLPSRGAASAKLLQLSKATRRRLGEKGVEEVGEVAAREVGVLGTAAKTTKKLESLGEELSSLYDKLDEVGEPLSRDALTSRLLTSLKEKQVFPDPRIERLASRELKNILSSTEALNATQRWRLAGDFEKRARVFERSKIAADETTAGVLTNMARTLRQDLYTEAEEAGIKALVPKSRLYGKLKVIEEAQKEKALGHVDLDLAKLPGKILSELGYRGRALVPTPVGVGAGAVATKSFLDILESVQSGRKE